MSELKFANTKWDARTWTTEQKIKWQEKAFELGYTFCGGLEPIYLCSGFFFLESDSTITQTNDLKVFQGAEELVLELIDMFPQEVEPLEPKVETKQSVFTRPRWVTSLTFLERKVIGITEGKDYKVIDVVYKGGELHQCIVCNDEGVVTKYHISHFHKVTPEECTYLPSVETEAEECNGFENLVYTNPSVGYTNMRYFVLLKESCSEAQWMYCQKHLPLTTGSYGRDLTLQICNDGDGWFDNDSVDDSDILVSFNDIFQEVY